MNQDDKWMALALKEAARGRNRTWPNPWVGSVIVRGGRLLGRGHHSLAGGPHAEIDALNHAGSRARGATLYVSLEPCNHLGKTGPCSHAILRSGIKRVVAACPDPNPKAKGGLAFLKRHGVEVGPWALRREAEELNFHFFQAVRMGRPWITLKAAASLDGKTALAKGESKWITSQAARRDARRLRGQCDAVLVGAGTVLRDNPALLPDKSGGFTPWRVILDPRGRLTGRERLLRDRFSHRTIWLAGPGLSARRSRSAWDAGAEVVRLKSRDLDGCVREALKWMSARPLRRVMVEGGSQTLGAFLRCNLADEVVLYLAPRLIGGERSLGLFGGPGPRTLDFLTTLSDPQTTLVGGDLKVQAHVHRDH